MCCGPGLVPACAVSVDLEPCTGHCAVPSRGFWPSLIKSPPAVTLTSRVARWWLRALVTVAAEGRTGGMGQPCTQHPDGLLRLCWRPKNLCVCEAQGVPGASGACGWHPPGWGAWRGRAARREQEGVGMAAGALDCQASSKPVPREENKKTKNQEKAGRQEAGGAVQV